MHSGCSTEKAAEQAQMLLHLSASLCSTPMMSLCCRSVQVGVRWLVSDHWAPPKMTWLTLCDKEGRSYPGDHSPGVGTCCWKSLQLSLPGHAFPESRWWYPIHGSPTAIPLFLSCQWVLAFGSGKDHWVLSKIDPLPKPQG